MLSIKNIDITKASFQRFQPRIINYREYKRFQNDMFREFFQIFLIYAEM